MRQNYLAREAASLRQISNSYPRGHRAESRFEKSMFNELVEVFGFETSC